jgi:hypothetical protein
LDQHFEQFDMEVYNHITQTKSPVINNRFFVDSGYNGIKQVYAPKPGGKKNATPINGQSLNNSAVMSGNQMRKKTTSVEPPENVMVELDYKSKSSIGYQRLP